MLHVFIQIIVQLCCFNCPPSWLSIVRAERPAYSQPQSAAYEDGAQSADASTEDDEFCRAYFSATARREMRKAAKEGDVAEQTKADAAAPVRELNEAFRPRQPIADLSRASTEALQAAIAPTFQRGDVLFVSRATALPPAAALRGRI